MNWLPGSAKVKGYLEMQTFNARYTNTRGRLKRDTGYLKITFEMLSFKMNVCSVTDQIEQVLPNWTETIVSTNI